MGHVGLAVALTRTTILMASGIRVVASNVGILTPPGLPGVDGVPGSTGMGIALVDSMTAQRHAKADSSFMVSFWIYP